MPRPRRRQINLRDNMVLNKYFCHLFGFENFTDFRDFMKSADEGYDEQGRSYFLLALLSRGEKLNISPDKLEEYDLNIRDYVEHISRNRPQPISLKYFQYLSVLFTEIYLDEYFSNPITLLNEINGFLEEKGL